MAIKVFYSDQLNAPVLNGLIGSLIDVLDACLVTGYNQVEVSTVIRTGSTVVVETVNPHGFTGPRDNYWSDDYVGNIATIAGCDQIEYNGEWPLKVISETSFSFDIGLAAPDSPATGVEIICKRSPAGFAKPFEGVNKAAYRSNDPTSRRFYLQVVDTGDSLSGTGGRMAWWRGFEKMVDVDFGQQPFPMLEQSGIQGQRLRKSNAANNSSRRWTLISDGKAFFFQTHTNVGGNSSSFGYTPVGYFFGDFIPLAPDPYAVMIEGDTSSINDTEVTTMNTGLFAPSGQNSPNPQVGVGWTCIARRYNGLASPVWAAGKLGHGLSQQAFGERNAFTFPDPYSNRLHVSQMKLFEGSIFRGLLPFYEGMSGLSHYDRQIIGNVTGIEGRKLVCIRGCNGYNYYQGQLFIDLTGEENGSWS